MYVTYHQNKTTSKLYKARNILNLISWSEGRKIWVKTNQSETENWMVRERERESWREGSPSRRMQQQEARAITRRFPGSIWERERDGNEGSGRTAVAEDGANHAEGGQAPTAAQANPGGGVLCRGDEINETACTKSTKITTGLRSKFSEYMKST